MDDKCALTKKELNLFMDNYCSEIDCELIYPEDTNVSAYEYFRRYRWDNMKNEITVKILKLKYNSDEVD